MTLCVVTKKLEVETSYRSTVNITSQVQEIISTSNIRTGICTIFVHHTSASIIICENSDTTVQKDLERFMAKLVLDGDPMYEHCAEGPDDMPAHIRSVLTQTSISIPFSDSNLALGIWQGLYLWEHRTRPHKRNISITMLGE